MKDDWKSTIISEAYSAAIGNDGDVFHHFVIKPYIASALYSTFREKRPQKVTENYFKLLEPFNNIECDVDFFVEEPEEIDASVASYKECLDHQINDFLKGVSGIKVLDLGGGEGFIPRWLWQNISDALVVDISQTLLEKGTQKAKELEGERIKFLEGDLENIGEDEDLESWLESVKSHAENSQNASPQSANKTDEFCEFDLVLCINVFDHLCSAERALRAISKYARTRNKQCLVIFSTLSEEFFIGPKDYPVPSDGQPPERQASEVSLGPAQQTVTAKIHSVVGFEQLLSSAGFQVLSLDRMNISQYPVSVQKKFKMEARVGDGNEKNLAKAPFNLWTILFSGVERPCDTATLNGVLENNDVLKEILESDKEYLRDNVDALTVHQFGKDQMINYQNNLSSAVYAIVDGSAHMQSTNSQEFPKNSFYGELETGNDFLVSRYLYPIRAGNDGCILLRIPLTVFNQMGNDPKSKSIGSIIYKTLRDRVATYSWVYHRADERSGKSQPVLKEGFLSKRFGPRDSLKRVNTKQCERLARNLMFAATMEGGNIRASSRVSRVNSGSAVFIDIDVVDDLVMNVDPRRNTSGRTIGETHRSAIDYLHKIGVIDAFSMHVFKNHRQGADRMLLVGELWDAFFKVICDTLEQNGCRSDEIYTFFDRQSFDGFFSPNSSISWDEVFSGTTVYCRQEKRYQVAPALQREGNELTDKIQKEISNRFLKPREQFDQISKRFVANLGKVVADFLNVTPRFFVLNDAYFLRRIALGAKNWEDEARSRLYASPYCFPDNQIGVHKHKFSEDIRLDRYIERFRIYAGNYWHNGHDLVYTNEAFRGEQYDNIP